MAINLDNAQYGKFVQFAQEQMQAGHATAIARDGGEVPGGDPLAGHSIAAATGDKVAPLWRSADNKNANNATRDLFRQTIVDMFDGEANIPASVRNAMKMEDYGQGKPLTARRILAVKTELDRIAAGNAAFNADIARAISDGRMERLPQEMQDGLVSVVEHFRDVFGADIVPAGKTIAQIVNAAIIASGVKALADAANAQGRPIATADLVGLYDQKASERLAGEVAGRFILAKIKALAPEISGTARSIAAQFEVRHPGLQADIAGCANPDEIAAALHNHEEQIDAFVDLVVRSNAAEKAVEAKATAKLASALGLDGRFVAAHVPTDELRGAARNLTTRIAAGTAPGSKDPGYDVEAAYDALVDAFVQKRLNACAAIDSLDLPADVKNRWKAEYISYHNVPPITPAQLFEVTKVLQGSASALQAILSGGMSPQETAEALDGIARTVNHVIREATGNPRFFDGVGLDEQIPIFGMMLMAAEAKTPALGQAIRNAGAAFLGQIDEYCESYAQSASPFVKALAIRTNAALISSLTDKDKFLAAMEKETGAALAECGVTDAKVCKDVENAMRKIAGDALSGATNLKALSDVLATAKAEAAALARTLDGIAKVRRSALNVAATAIAASSGLGKGFVLNNLDARDISSSTGKLRLLYDDVLKKARNGQGVDNSAAANKANDIIGTFIREKVAILKEIDEAGFGPAERAEHKLAALRYSDWTDPDIAKVAKGLAGNEALKNAARNLADALSGEAPADLQARDAFLAFGKVLVTTLKGEFKDQAEKWAGSVDDRKRLVRMVVQLLDKEQPGIAEALARMVAPGRFDSVKNLLVAAHNDVRSLRADYDTLRNNNLMGPPAGEPLRSVLNNPALQYDEAKFEECLAQDEIHSFANLVVGSLEDDFPPRNEFNADKYIAFKTKGRGMIAKYAEGLPQETVPILARLVRVLDWRGNAAAASEEIVKNYAEDMKAWRDIAPGSPDAKGLQDVLQRRMNDYFKDVLVEPKRFNKGDHSGIFQTFLEDLPRCKYAINGKTIRGKTLQEKMVPFLESIKDPAKRKAVSVMINQQMWGDYTASVANRLPFSGWKAGMQDEPIDTVPGIEKFASRDFLKTGYQLFDTGPMEFAIEVAPDESTVTVRTSSAYPMHADISVPAATTGTCTVTQEFVIDFTGAEPAIRDLRIGQALT